MRFAANRIPGATGKAPIPIGLIPGSGQPGTRRFLTERVTPSLVAPGGCPVAALPAGPAATIAPMPGLRLWVGFSEAHTGAGRAVQTAFHEQTGTVAPQGTAQLKRLSPASVEEA